MRRGHHVVPQESKGYLGRRVMSQDMLLVACLHKMMSIVIGFSAMVGVICSNSMNMNTRMHVMSPCRLLLHRHSINHTHGYNQHSSTKHLLNCSLHHSLIK